MNILHQIHTLNQKDGGQSYCVFGKHLFNILKLKKYSFNKFAGRLSGLKLGLQEKKMHTLTSTPQ